MNRLGIAMAGLAGLLGCSEGSAPAIDALRAGELRFEGNGCPNGAEPGAEPKPEFLPEGPTFAYSEFAFADFVVLGGVEPEPARAECQIAREIDIPAGVQLRIMGGEWGGAAELVGAGTGGVDRQFRFDGEPPRSRDVSFDPDFSGTFFLRDDLRDTVEYREGEGWTACSDAGARRTARATIRIQAQGEGTQVSVNLGRVFSLEQRDCS